MKAIKNGSLLFIISMGFLTSCGDINKKMEEKILQLNTKALQLDSLVNTEIDRVKELEPLMNYENIKVQKLDSMIEKSTFKIDSIARQKIQFLKEIAN